MLLVLDQFNDAGTNSNLSGFIGHLATSSLRTKRLTVLIIVSDFETYTNMLSMNGGQKIHGVYTNPADLPFWDKKMISSLFDEEVAKRKPDIDYLVPLKDQIVEMATTVCMNRSSC